MALPFSEINLAAIPSKLLRTLNPYKWFLLLGVVIVYTVAVWHVCSQYTSSGWQKEKIALVQRALDTSEKRQELAVAIGTELDKRLSSIQAKQTTINQKVIREIIKEPIYTTCVTTPDGVRLIEDTIRNKGYPTTK